MNRAGAPTHLDWLYQTQFSGPELGLARIERLLGELPGPRGKPPITLHVAGTNGKGSICAFADQLLQAHGLTTGLFTSPHLVQFHERIRVNGQLIPDDSLQEHLGRIRNLVANWESRPTFFELALALALQHFYACDAGAIVLETGLGGRLDATNAVRSVSASVISTIDFDHMHILGDTLAAIAEEKAGIFKPGTPVVSAPQSPEARTVLEKRARTLECSITFLQQCYGGKLSLLGDHQHLNAAVALVAVEAAGIKLDSSLASQALHHTVWPGRFQRWGEDQRFVIDAAHNPGSATVLAATWQKVYPSEPATIIFGCARDKAAEEVLKNLAPICHHIVLTPIPSPRSMGVETLGKIARSLGLSHTLTRSIGEALGYAQRRAPRILICGSIFLAGEVLARLQGLPLPRPMTQ